jgi:hypothetical protein
MRPQKQANRHRPGEGIYGDCHRTCVAMLLDLDKEQVPNWGAAYPDDGAKFKEVSEAWLRAYGYATFSVAFASSWDDVGQYMLKVNPGVYYILGGQSRTGVNHSVVAVNNLIAFDPSLNDSGIIAPCDDGHYWVTVLVPIGMTVAASQRHDPEYEGLREDAE